MLDFSFGQRSAGISWFGCLLFWLFSPLWTIILVIEWIVFWWMDRRKSLKGLS